MKRALTYQQAEARADIKVVVAGDRVHYRAYMIRGGSDVIGERQDDAAQQLARAMCGATARAAALGYGYYYLTFDQAPARADVADETPAATGAGPCGAEGGAA
jgi:hypothetical protein